MKLLLLVTLLTAGDTAHSTSRQAVQRFGNVFDCNPESNISPKDSYYTKKLKFYGCLCHKHMLSHNVNVVRCCQKHDSCYDEVKKLGSCDFPQGNPSAFPYSYTCIGRKLVCSDENNACEAAICNCDRQATICIYRELFGGVLENFLSKAPC